MYAILNLTNQAIILTNLTIQSNESLIISDEHYLTIDQTELTTAITNNQIEVVNLDPPIPSLTPSISVSSTPLPSVTPSITVTPTPSVTPSSLSISNMFLSTIKNTVQRTINSKLNDQNISILDFYQVTDGLDYGPALNRAIQTKLPIYWPAGIYTVNNPVQMLDGMEVIGASRCRPGSMHGATYIIAPKGLFINNTTTRTSIYIKNLHFVGTGSGYGIQGPFGGDIEGCKIENYIDLIQNPSSYLSRYSYNSFRAATTGLNLADSNGTIIEYNHFECSVQTAITNQTVTPMSGTNNGSPLTIRGNNFNINSANFLNNSVLKIRGLVIGYANYFEDFSITTASNAIMVDVTVNQWDKFGFIWYGNQMNGQGKSLYGIRFNGTTTNPNNAAGFIVANRIAGFIGSPITFGTNNNITGLRIMDNNRGDSDTVLVTGGPSIAYRPFATSKFSTSVTVSGTAAVGLPIGQIKVFDNANIVNSTYFKIPVSGVYRVTAAVDFSSTTTLSLYNGTSLIDSSKTGTLNAILNLTVGNTLYVKGQGGTTATNGTFTLEYLGDGNS